MRLLADTNVPMEYVAALRGDGHEVVYTRTVDQLGPAATDDAIVEYAVERGWAILSTDVKDFGGRNVAVAIFVAPQDMQGGEVRRAVARIDALPFDPADADPIWLTSV